jgi:undecaprenyl-diphosphatase
MTTFQAIVTAIVTVLSEILPVSSIAHHRALNFFFGWGEPSGPLLGTIYLGLFLALLFVFKYDFLSFFSQTLQVIIYRKRPTAIDEKLPIFVIIALIAPTLVWFLFHYEAATLFESPLLLAGILAISGLPMVFLDNYYKKNKTHYDWNWVDSLVLGLGQAFFIIPGVGRASGALTAAAMRNYSRSGAAKFILYGATPMMGAASYFHLSQTGFHSFAPISLSYLTFWSTLLVSFLTGLLVVHSFIKQMGQGSLWKYAIYRFLLAAAIVVIYFAREQGIMT